MPTFQCIILKKGHSNVLCLPKLTLLDAYIMGLVVQLCFTSTEFGWYVYIYFIFLIRMKYGYNKPEWYIYSFYIKWQDNTIALDV